MNKLDKTYQDLLQDILDNGVTKQDRTGTGTISVFGRQIRHDMKDGFPLLTTKKMPWKTIVTELLWFLRGDTNIKYLVDNGCNIWNGDAYKNYSKKSESQFIPNEDGTMTVISPASHYNFLSQEKFIDKIKTDDEFAKKWGELGPIYGKQWRKWETYDNEQPPYLDVDQIQNLISDLKTNPDSRRLMVNAWNVGELDQMVLPPCHYGFQVYTRELSEDERYNLLSDTEKKSFIVATNPDVKYGEEVKYTLDTFYNHIPTRAISLMWNQRSVDTFLGLPFNIASYGLLLEIIAKEVNMVPDELIGNLGDVHLYSNHIDAAKEQIGKELTYSERRTYRAKLVREGKIPFNGEVLEDDFKDLDKHNIPKHTREPFELPDMTINPNNKMRIGGGIFTYDIGDFTLEGYQSHPTIKAPLSN
jgi:thymidylate synthase